MQGPFSDQRRRWFASILIALAWIAWLTTSTHVAAQPVSPVPPADTVASTDAASSKTIRVEEDKGLNFLSLILKGGWFMVPIGLTSLLVVTITIERLLALRRGRVLPNGLVRELGELAAGQGQFDPREAYRICQRYPSAAARVVRDMLLKIGRPHSEVEHTVAEASEREATRLYTNVRWLNLAAAVAPLLGLLGTVWGMIDAFHRTTQLSPGQNKADELATGIYIALVTTFGGLMVAIPAAIFAHYFEGRIQKLFYQIDELLFNLLPQIEPFEGRVRFSRQTGDGQTKKPKETSTTPKRL